MLAMLVNVDIIWGHSYGISVDFQDERVACDDMKQLSDLHYLEGVKSQKLLQ